MSNHIARFVRVILGGKGGAARRRYFAPARAAPSSHSDRLLTPVLDGAETRRQPDLGHVGIELGISLLLL